MTEATISEITLDEASRNFGGFYAPRFEVQVEGVPLDEAIVRDVLEVRYADSMTDIDSFDLVVNNWDSSARAFKYVGAEPAAPPPDANPSGKTWSLFEPYVHRFNLKLGYGSTLVSMMRGSTRSLEPSFPSGGAPTLNVRVLNVLHELRTKPRREYWTKDGPERISAVVRKLGETPLEGGERFPLPIAIDDKALDAEAEEEITQDNQFDIDFLLLQARRVGYNVFIRRRPANGNEAPADELYFGPTNAAGLHAGRSRYRLRWGESLIDFRPSLSVANQLFAAGTAAPTSTSTSGSTWHTSMPAPSTGTCSTCSTAAARQTGACCNLVPRSSPTDHNEPSRRPNGLRSGC